MLIARVDLPDQKITAVILAYIVIGAIAAIPYTALRGGPLAHKEE
jgi:hypothetical protein